MKDRMTKRIVRTLTTESACSDRLKYEKELLNSGKNGQFSKTNRFSFVGSVCFGSPLVELPADPAKRIVRERAVEPRKNNPLLQNESPRLPRPLVSLDGGGTR